MTIRFEDVCDVGFFLFAGGWFGVKAAPTLILPRRTLLLFIQRGDCAQARGRGPQLQAQAQPRCAVAALLPSVFLRSSV
jgi:hypothetical protein